MYIPRCVSWFLSESLAFHVNYASDSDFEGGWPEPGVDGWPHIWHSHGTSERRRAGPAHALHCISQHPEDWVPLMAVNVTPSSLNATHTHAHTRTVAFGSCKREILSAAWFPSGIYVCLSVPVGFQKFYPDKMYSHLFLFMFFVYSVLKFDHLFFLFCYYVADTGNYKPKGCCGY